MVEKISKTIEKTEPELEVGTESVKDRDLTPEEEAANLANKIAEIRKRDELNLQKQKEAAIEQKKQDEISKKEYYKENYDMELSVITQEMDILIEGLSLGPQKGLSIHGRSLPHKLEDQNMFLEVCAKMEGKGQDFMMLKEKKDKLDALIKELEDKEKVAQ